MVLLLLYLAWFHYAKWNSEKQWLKEQEDAKQKQKWKHILKYLPSQIELKHSSEAKNNTATFRSDAYTSFL